MVKPNVGDRVSGQHWWLEPDAPWVEGEVVDLLSIQFTVYDEQGTVRTYFYKDHESTWRIL